MVSVSVIIPAWNEAKTLKATLEALLYVDYDVRLCEVIVVAGGDDNTYEIAKDVADVMRVFSRYVVLPQKSEGKNAAIQQGIKEAKNGTIVLLDADTIASEQWLKRMVAPIEQGTCHLTIANPEPLKKTWISQYYLINKAYLLDRIVTYSGNSMAFNADIVKDRMEYFFDSNVKVGVDYLLAKRFMSQGLKVVFARDASVVTHTPSCLKYFVLTELRWLTARINIDGVSYRGFAANTVVIGALMSAIPLSKTVFILSLLFNGLFISKKIRVFLIGSRHYNTSVRNVFGFVFLSYVFHIVGFIAYVKWFLGLHRTSNLSQGQRY